MPSHAVMVEAVRFSALAVQAMAVAFTAAARLARKIAALDLGGLGCHGLTRSMFRLGASTFWIFTLCLAMLNVFGGRGVESRTVLVTKLPSASNTETWWWFAL